jgi:hypothetical protein
LRSTSRLARRAEGNGIGRTLASNAEDDPARPGPGSRGGWRDGWVG